MTLAFTFECATLYTTFNTTACLQQGSVKMQVMLMRRAPPVMISLEAPYLMSKSSVEALHSVLGK